MPHCRLPHLGGNQRLLLEDCNTCITIWQQQQQQQQQGAYKTLSA
jgi:hypothetical protein